MNANFCKRTLLCQSCAVRRAGKLIEGYARKVEHTLNGTNLKPVMLTFTVKNGGDLGERFDHLHEAHKAMIAAARKAASNPTRNLPLEWNKVQGSVRSYEVTMGKDGLWHPHFHAFALIADWIDQPKLSAEWERFTGDSKIVGVSLCDDGIVPGLVETLKYSTKFSSMNPEQVWKVHQTLGGRRLVDSTGLLRGVQVGDLDQDEITGLEGPWRDYLASWLWAKQGYTLEPFDDLVEATKDPSSDSEAAFRGLLAQHLRDRESRRKLADILAEIDEEESRRGPEAAPEPPLQAPGRG
jgi:hypothetical protein